MHLQHARSERKAIEISLHADDGGVHQQSIILIEVCLLQPESAHIRVVALVRSMTVIVLDHLVKKLLEYFVRTGRSGVHPDTVILVGGTCHDARLECDAVLTLLVLVLFPEFGRQKLVAMCVHVWERALSLAFLVIGQIESQVRLTILERVVGLVFLGHLGSLLADAIHSISH